MICEEFQWVRSNARGGLAFWQAYEPAVKADLSCVALRVGERLLFVDPIPLAEPALEELTDGAVAAGVVLTNGNHERAAAWFARRFGIPVWAHPEAIPELSLAGVEPLEDGGTLLDCVSVAALPGGGPGEVALHWEELGGVWTVGDALVNLEATGFAFLPEKYCRDAKQLHRSARRLLERGAEVMTFAHGLPLVSNARRRLEGLLEAG